MLAQTKDIPVDQPKYRIFFSKKIGSGNQGETFIGQILETNQEVVIKKVPLQTNRTYITREVEVMKKWFLFVKNILIDYYEDRYNHYIVLEKINGVTLGQYLINYPVTQEQNAIKFFIKMASAVYYLHYGSQEEQKNLMIHRDIKPDNFVLRGEDPILIDFGLSKLTHTSEATQGTIGVGTPKYQSPEQLSEGEYSPKVDVWSLGCVFYEILYGIHPFPVKVSTVGLFTLLDQCRVYFPDCFKISEQIKHLIKRMLVFEEQERADIQEVVESLNRINQSYSH